MGAGGKEGAQSRGCLGDGVWTGDADHGKAQSLGLLAQPPLQGGRWLAGASFVRLRRKCGRIGRGFDRAQKSRSA
jgi:hypothetical protein